MKRAKYVAASFTIFVAVWFLGVDWSWFVHHCPDCGYGNDVAQYRVFTVAVHEKTRPSPTITQQVAADLGVPCRHPNITCWHKHRFWGLLVCSSPCINGIDSRTGDNSWYDHDVSAKVGALAAADKSIADEFVQTVLVNHDFSFVRTVLDRTGVESEAASERQTK